MDPLRDSANRLSSLIGSPVVIEDHHFNLLARSPQSARADGPALRRSADDAARRHFETFEVDRADRPVLVPASPDGTIQARWCLPIRWDGITHAYAWSIADPARPPARLSDAIDVTETLGELLAERFRREDARSGAAGRLLTATDPAQLRDALEELDRHCGWSADQPITIVVARGSKSRPPPSTLADLSAVRADVPGPDAVLLVPQDATASLRSMRVRASSAFDHGAAGPWWLGVGESLALHAARTSWRQARTAARVATTREGPAGVALHWADLGVQRLMSVGTESALLAAAVPESVHALLEHEDRELLHTARTYLDLSGQAQLTADRLAVHRQTLYRRLRRVEEITGLDLLDGQDRLTLHLALTLASLMSRPAERSSR